MPRLVIPTRNRPASIARVLRYLAEFYPGTEVVVADGSDSSYNAGYAEAVEQSADSLNLVYQLYGPKPTLGERMLDAMNAIEDEFVIVGADDDYPILDVLMNAESFLLKNPDYVLAIGGIIGLRLFDNGDIQAKLLYARAVECDSAIRRVNNFIQWPYATSYGVVRREHYIERCGRAEINGFPGFGDYSVAFHDCLAGKIKALDEICYFTTTNPTHSKLRRRSALFYLERAQEVLALKEHYREALMQQRGVSAERAESIAARLINTRIVEMGTPALQNRPGFGRSPFFQDPIVRKQYDDFQALFTEDNDVRRRLITKLRAVVSAMIEVSRIGSDNLGEPEIYDSLDAMQPGARLKEVKA